MKCAKKHGCCGGSHDNECPITPREVRELDEQLQQTQADFGAVELERDQLRAELEEAKRMASDSIDAAIAARADNEALQGLVRETASLDCFYTGSKGAPDCVCLPCRATKASRPAPGPRGEVPVGHGFVEGDYPDCCAWQSLSSPPCGRSRNAHEAAPASAQGTTACPPDIELASWARLLFTVDDLDKRVSALSDALATRTWVRENFIGVHPAEPPQPAPVEVFDQALAKATDALKVIGTGHFSKPAPGERHGFKCGNIADRGPHASGECSKACTCSAQITAAFADDSLECGQPRSAAVHG